MPFLRISARRAGAQQRARISKRESSRGSMQRGFWKGAHPKLDARWSEARRIGKAVIEIAGQTGFDAR